MNVHCVLLLQQMIQCFASVEVVLNVLVDVVIVDFASYVRPNSMLLVPLLHVGFLVASLFHFLVRLEVQNSSHFAIFDHFADVNFIERITAYDNVVFSTQFHDLVEKETVEESSIGLLDNSIYDLYLVFGLEVRS